VFVVDRESVLGVSRRQRFSWPRHVLCYVLRQSGWELAAIGDRIGRDHSSVHHACKSVARRVAVDRDYAYSVGMVKDGRASYEGLTEDERALEEIIQSAAQIEQAITDAVQRVAAAVANLERMELRARSLRRVIDNPVQTRGAA